MNTSRIEMEHRIFMYHNKFIEGSYEKVNTILDKMMLFHTLLIVLTFLQRQKYSFIHYNKSFCSKPALVAL